MIPFSAGFQAGGTIAPSRCVKISTAADNKVLQAAASNSGGDDPVGISQEGMKGPPGVSGSDTAVAAAAGDNVQVVMAGVALAEAGAAVTRGDMLESDVNGKVITTAAGGGAGNHGIVGRALESASGAGVKIKIWVGPFKLYYAA